MVELRNITVAVDWLDYLVSRTYIVTWQRTKITYKRKNNKMEFDLYSFLKDNNYEGVIGIDEAGWGPVAGPLSVAAVYLDKHVLAPDCVKDSKKLNALKMVEAYKWVTTNHTYAHVFAHATSFSVLSPATIRNNCFKQVDTEVRKAIGKRRVLTIIDGVVNPIEHRHAKAIIKADSAVEAVSAASIIAKLRRDQFMIALGKQHPEYGFEQHMGYLTRRHREALEEYGPMEEHRANIKLIKDLIKRDSV